VPFCEEQRLVHVPGQLRGSFYRMRLALVMAKKARSIILSVKTHLICTYVICDCEGDMRKS
jgi:hypothetical protein